jgi:hypothetical protein
MITAHNARPTRRRGSSSDGKDDPIRPSRCAARCHQPASTTTATVNRCACSMGHRVNTLRSEFFVVLTKGHAMAHRTGGPPPYLHHLTGRQPHGPSFGAIVGRAPAAPQPLHDGQAGDFGRTAAAAPGLTRPRVETAPRRTAAASLAKHVSTTGERDDALIQEGERSSERAPSEPHYPTAPHAIRSDQRDVALGGRWAEPENATASPGQT